MVYIPDSLKVEDSRLKSCLENVALAVGDLWRLPLLQHYTDHSKKHSERIIIALGKLLEDYGSELNEYERFILLASAYLHDIGMQSPIHAGLTKKERYSEEEEEQIRALHNETTAKMIIDSLSPGSQLKLGLEKCARCASFIAEVCKYHRHLALEELDNKSIAGENIRLPLLAGLLRLGDELDVDFRRVCLEILKTRDIPPNSKYHWWAHHYVRSVNIKNGRITLHFEFPIKYKGNKLIEALREKVKTSLKDQFLEVYDLFDDYGLRLYKDINCTEDYSEIGIENIPKDLEEYIVQNVIGLKEISEQISKEGVQFWIDGVPYSDDTKVIECLNKIIKLIAEEKIKEAIKEVERCRSLTMGPRERAVFFIIAGQAYYYLGDNLQSKFYFEEALSISYRDDLRAVLKIESQKTESSALGNIGLIYQNMGDLNQALKCHQDALMIFKEIGDKKGEADQLGNIALIYRTKGDLNQALRCHQNALEIFRKIGFKPGEASILGNIGLIFRIKGDIAKALEYHQEALNIFKDIDFRLDEAIELNNMALIYQGKGDLNQALKCHQYALKIFREIGSRQGEASTLGNIGLIFRVKGDIAKALECFQAALKIFKENGFKESEANQSANIGWIYRIKGDLDQALRYRQNALAIFREVGNRESEADQLGNIGLIYQAKNDLKQALEYHEEALKISKELGFRKVEAYQLAYIGMICQKENHFDQALEYHLKALAIHKEIGNREGEADQLGNIGLVYGSKGNFERALEFHLESESIFREIGFREKQSIQLFNIGQIYQAKGDINLASKYFQDAVCLSE